MSPSVASGLFSQSPSSNATPASLGQKLQSWGGDHTALLALLGSGALGGTLGGVLASRTPQDPEENPAQRRRRIIMNVLGGGAAGAGIAGAGMLGSQSLHDASGGPPSLPNRLLGATKSLTGRALDAAALGTIGAKTVGKIQQKGLEKQLFSKDLPSEWQTPKGQGQTGLGNGKFTPAALDAAFNNPTARIGTDPSKFKTITNVSRPSAMTDAIQQAMGHNSPEETQAFIRGLGRVPVGESGIGASLRRGFMPHGTPGGPSLFHAGKLGFNPRMLGAGAGITAGLVGPEILGAGGKLLDWMTTAPTNQPGS